MNVNTTNIKNVVFDVGNVIVRWSPIEISQAQAKKLYQIKFGFSELETDRLFYYPAAVGS